MDVVYSTSIYRIYWYDIQQTILILDLYDRCAWSDVPEMIEVFNDVIAEYAPYKRIYAIGMLTENGSIIPKNMYDISQILELLKKDPSDEELSIFVLKFSLLHQLTKLATDLFKLQNKHHKYVFVETLDDAIKAIELHESNKSLEK